MEEVEETSKHTPNGSTSPPNDAKDEREELAEASALPAQSQIRKTDAKLPVSTAYDTGRTISVTLPEKPLQESKEEQPLSPDTYESPNSLSKSEHPPYILLVDDNAINLQLLVTFMRRASFPHASAVNGLEALETYKANAAAGKPFDYVLMDVSMPVMNGLDSTQEIRRYEKESGITKPAVIIALTGLASKEAQEDAFKAGLDHFMPKPVKFKALKEMLVER